MSEPKDSLYDISDAIVLSRRLTGEKATARKPSISPEDEPYIRFTAGVKPETQPRRTPPPAAAAAPVATPSVIEHAPLPTEPFGNWDEAIAWCIDFSKGRCGFIVDSQGFVMITHGKNIPEDGFEGAGANIGSVFTDLSQLELDSGAVRVAEITCETRSLLAIRIVDHNGEHCTLGLLSDDNTHVWPKHIVYQQIMKSMSNLLL